MQLYLDTFRALIFQFRAALVYVAGIVALGACVYFGDAALGLSGKPEDLPAWYGLYATVQDLMQVLGTAALQTACFAIIGSHIDRPGWRCASMRDAFQRFYLPWLSINLIGVVLSRAELRAVGAFGIDALGMFELLIMLGMLLLPVAGACVMHHGKPSWGLLGDALAPILRYPAMTMQAMVFHLVAYLLRGLILFGPLGVEPPAPMYYTLWILPFALLDLCGFVAMWRVCIHHRDHGHQDADPYDF